MTKQAWIVVILALLIAAPAFAQEPTPTITPTPQLSVPSGALTDILSEAGAESDTLPEEISAPNGTSLIPNANFGLAFGYLKWLISPPSQDDLAGPFAPIITDLGILLAVQVAYLAVYAVVYFIVYALRWGVWIFKLFIAVVEVIIGLLNSVIGKFIGLLGL